VIILILWLFAFIGALFLLEIPQKIYHAVKHDTPEPPDNTVEFIDSDDDDFDF
jgi:hypothetical protein